MDFTYLHLPQLHNQLLSFALGTRLGWWWWVTSKIRLPYLSLLCHITSSLECLSVLTLLSQQSTKSCPVSKTLSNQLTVFQAENIIIIAFYFHLDVPYHMLHMYKKVEIVENMCCCSALIDQRLLPSSFRLLIRRHSSDCGTVTCINLPNHRKVVLIKDLVFIFGWQFTNKVLL